MSIEHFFRITFNKAFILSNFSCCLVDSGRRRLRTGVLCLKGVIGGFLIFEIFNCSHNARRSAGIPGGGGGG